MPLLPDGFHVGATGDLPEQVFGHAETISLSTPTRQIPGQEIKHPFWVQRMYSDCVEIELQSFIAVIELAAGDNRRSLRT